jgi:hypothetical protein
MTQLNPKFRDVLATLGAPEDAVATSTSGEWSAMSLLKAIYAGVQTIGAPDMDIASDSGSVNILLATETLTIAGGTGLATSGAANTITVDIDDAELLAIAGLTSAADRLPYFTGSGTASLATFTAAGRALVDDADATTQLSTLGLSANGKSLVTAADYAAMKALLDLEIGTDVQAYDADLTTWAGLTPSANAQSLVTAANYAAMRALLDLEAGTDFYSIAAADAAFQPIDADLTSWAGVTRASGFDTFAATPSLANLGSLLTDEATGLITFMTTSSSANLRALLTDETGTGLAYFQGGDAGTPSALVLTNATGLTSAGVAAATLVTAADTVASNDNDTTWPTTAAIIDYAQPLDADLTAIAALTTTAAARTLLEIADPGADRPVVWDDTAGVFKAMAIADMTTEASPAAGDYVMIMGAEGDWRKADWSTLPGAGGGINNVSEDTSPSLGGALDGGGFDVIDIGVLTMREQAAAEADVAGLGQWWVQTATPNLPMFTNDAGDDFQLATLTGTETLTNKSIATGQITGWGTGVNTFLVTPSYTNLAAALTGSVLKTAGVETIWIPAGAMKPKSTNGAGASTYDSGTNDVTVATLDFDTTTQEYAHTLPIGMPKSWDEGTITAVFYWTNTGGASTETVRWSIAGVAISNDDTLNAAMGTAQTVDDTWLAQNDLHITSATAAVTIGGTPAQDDLVVFEISRVTASDNMAGDAKLIGVKILVTTNATNDA